MLIYDDIRFKLNNVKPKLDDLRLALDLDKAKIEIEELEHKAAEPEFWNDPSESQKVLQRTKQLKDKVANYAALYTMYEDVVTTIEMAEEMEDESLFPEVQEGFAAFEKELDRQTLSTLLSGEYDRNNAILSFHAGAGGTEAMDWTSMLIRMYEHWADNMGFKHKILDFLDGEDAGVKSAEMLIEGENAYGYLKSENGVHRLVRVSPFDANARRQTSFSAIEVIPEIADESEDFEIRPEDYEMQVYRSSGAGGQKVNKTSSAVRLIHKSGIVVSCQTERSQFQNKETCLRMLRSKLVEIREREHLATISDIKGVQQKIEWGSQIRNYVFMPYTLVKDTRTGCETSNVNGVMDGALDPFIESYLNCLATGNWVQK